MTEFNDLPASWKRKGAQVVLLSVALGVVLTLMVVTLDKGLNTHEVDVAAEIDRCQSLGYRGVTLGTGECVNPAGKKVVVQVLSVNDQEVYLKVDGKKFKLEGDELDAWNQNRLLRFNAEGPTLRKSQIPTDHYRSAIRKYVPIGDAI
jgi:hypothetical protein